MTDVVPFGKYRGRPLVDLIADRSYTDWLAAQPWFRERYQTVYNLIVNTGTEPQDTPEHNKMQARFLDHDLCLSLMRRWIPDPVDLTATWSGKAARLTEKQRANVTVEAPYASVSALTFEAYGWDLHIATRTALPVAERTTPTCDCECTPEVCGVRAVADAPADSTKPVDAASWSKCFTSWQPRRRDRHCGVDCPATWSNLDTYREVRAGLDFLYWYEKFGSNTAGELSAVVELKPVLGDDYPSVLRDVVKRADTSHARGLRFKRVAVLADDVQFEGVDHAAVRKIFRSQRVDLMTTAELPLPSIDWRCHCKDCVAP